MNRLTMTRAIPDSAPQVPAVLTRWRSAIDSAMRRAVPPPDNAIGRMASYHMGWTDAGGHETNAGPGNGKLFRGHLVIWASDALDGDPRRALPVAAAVEWLHAFTLIHDDVQDGDLLRRGRPAVRAIWGDGQAINAGDALHAIAVRELLAPGDAPAARNAAARTLLDGLLEVIDGQCRDLELEHAVATPRATYLAVIERKTGALTGASLEAGARIAGGDDAIARNLARTGRLLGMAFQLRDDWLGTWGDPQQTGKSRNGDLERRKIAYPIVLAYERATPRQRADLERLFASNEPSATERLRELVDGVAGAALAAEAAVDLAAQSIGVVAEAGLGTQSIREFADVAEYAARRDR